jgi:hypothetical protein
MSMRAVWMGVATWAVALAICAAGARAAEPEDDLGRYPLDGAPRTLPRGARLPCAQELVVRRGDALRYGRPVRVHPAFADRLAGFERLVAELARSIYGRAPARIEHLGGYNCRRIRLYPDFVSEHALGNAIDVAGFDFAPLPRGSALPAELPASLRRGFAVRIERHWESRGGGANAVHQRFLHTLAHALIARTDLFRVVLGPAWPGHKNHLHLDCAPYRMIEVF